MIVFYVNVISRYLWASGPWFDDWRVLHMDLLPDTLNYGLCMRRDWREHFLPPSNSKEAAS